MWYLIEAARSKGLDRIAIAYAVSAWAVVQAASIAAPAYAWAPWVLQVIILTALLGLPVVLIGAWTRGVRGGAGGHLKPSRADWHVLVTLSAGALVLGAVVVWAFWPRTSVAPALAESVAAAPANSLAVLPFANLSGKANDYFSDGITDELLNALAGRGGLRIAARTSSFAFKGKNLDAQTIARALHVRNLLTGSVREAGNHVRITAQLTNASDGYALWSQSFDRDLTDILAVQSDIANAITNALARAIGGVAGSAPPRDRAEPIDRDAFRLYLEAKDLAYRGNEDDLNRAVGLLHGATEKAPDFANGYVLLGHSLFLLYERYNNAAALPSAEIAAQQALNLDTGNVAALGDLMRIRLEQWRWNDALELFRKIQAAHANQALVLHQRAAFAYIFNYFVEDRAAELKAAELDPLNPGLWYALAVWYYNEKRYDEAAAAIHRVLQLRHGTWLDRDWECLIAVGRGRLDDARQLSDSIPGYYADSANLLSCPFAIAFARHDTARARAMIAAAIADYQKRGGSSENAIAEAYRTLGDLKNAMPWYERAYEARDTLLLFVPYEKFQTRALLDYPPWKELWSRPPIRAWEAARVEAGKILGVVGS
jgi:TolB-like protein/tetratricopeptide (TPR) repeat protein